MNFRTASGAEMLIAHDLWQFALYPSLRNTRIVDDYLSIENMAELVDRYGYAPHEGQLPEQWDRRCAFVCDDRSPLRFIFCPKDAGIAVWAHEFGHAVCDTLYPESRKWNDEQLEAFALLANVNAQRKLPTDEGAAHERTNMALHTRACRRTPVYREALRWAWTLRKLPLKQQMDAIARGRTEASRPAAPDQVPLVDAEIEF